MKPQLCNYCGQPVNPDWERDEDYAAPVLPVTSRHTIAGCEDHIVIGVTNEQGCEHFREARVADDGGDGPWSASLSYFQDALELTS